MQALIKFLIYILSSIFGKKDPVEPTQPEQPATPPLPTEEEMSAELTKAYRLQLGRDPTADELQVRLQELSEHMSTLNSISDELYNSVDGKEYRHFIKQSIEAFYNKYLHRDPDTEGYMSYYKRAYEQTATLAEIEEEIATSMEAHNIISNIRTDVNELYKEVLKREADDEGLKTYSTKIYARKLSLEELRDILTQSEEYKAMNRMPEGYPLKSFFLAEYSTHAGRAVWTSMGLLARNKDDNYRQSIIDKLRNAGANEIGVYIVNDNDYSEQNIKVLYQPKDRELWIKWLTRCREAGLEPTVWMMSDDPFNHFNRNSFDEITTYWNVVINEVLEPLKIKRLVPGLEAREYWRDSALMDKLGRWLKNRCPWATICFHNEPNQTEFFERDWVDMIFWQTSFWGTPEKLKGEVQYLTEKYKKPVVACEYSMEGTTAEAQALGNAAIEGGAWGALNGFGSGGPKSEQYELLKLPLPSGRFSTTAGADWEPEAFFGPVATDVKNWPKTINFKEVNFGGTQIHFNFSKSNGWVQGDIGGGSMSVANGWILQRINGKVTATTFEYFRPNQTSKGAAALYNLVADQGGKKSPFTLKKGETYGIMLSTLARNNYRTTNERSNILLFTI